MGGREHAAALSGLLDHAQARSAVELKRFRNVSVHGYAKLDHKRVHHHALKAPAAIREILDALRPHASELP